MIDRRTFRLMQYFLQAYPLSSARMVVLLILAGLAEGVGVLTLLPVMQLASSEAGSGSGAAQIVVAVLAIAGFEPSLGSLISVIVIAMILKALLLWVAMRTVGNTVAQVTTDLRMSLMRALLAARWRYFQSQSTGRFANAVSGEAGAAARAYEQGCVVIAGCIQVAVYLVTAFIVSWQVAVLALLASAFVLVLFRGFATASRKAGKDQTLLTRSLAERLTDSLRSMKPVKAMGREEHLKPLLEAETEGLDHAMRQQVMAVQTLKLVQEPMLAMLLGAGLYFSLGVWGLPFPSIMVLAFIFYRVMINVNKLQLDYQVVVNGESAYWSLREQLDRAAHEREEVSGSRMPSLDRGIELDSVWFSYASEPILRGVSLTIPANRFVTLFGPSGAGKSTIADLILRLQEPDAGWIRVDGIPLQELDIRQWRRMVGYVPQETLVFHDSVFHNVTLGDPSISREDVEEALRAVGAWPFIATRPHGLDTLLGEQGVLFSGGQRQRIAIARALVHRPRLLILDEVTSTLDPDAEAAICDTLASLSGAATILAISHQQALREPADIVYRVREGTVAVMAGDEVDV
jgi:ATP-binding cassette subfamily C protein